MIQRSPLLPLFRSWYCYLAFFRSFHDFLLVFVPPRKLKINFRCFSVPIAPAVPSTFFSARRGIIHPRMKITKIDFKYCLFHSCTPSLVKSFILLSAIIWSVKSIIIFLFSGLFIPSFFPARESTHG